MVERYELSMDNIERCPNQCETVVEINYIFKQCSKNLQEFLIF